MKIRSNGKKENTTRKAHDIKSTRENAMCLYFTQTQKLCACYYYLHAQFHSLDHQLVDYLLSQILEKKNTFNPYIHELHN